MDQHIILVTVDGINQTVIIGIILAKYSTQLTRYTNNYKYLVEPEGICETIRMTFGVCVFAAYHPLILDRFL